jgi:hypothetical protein
MPRAFAGTTRLNKNKGEKYPMEKSEKLDEYYYYEALDRTSMLCDILEENLASHPVFQQHKMIATDLEKVVDDLWEIYTQIAILEDGNTNDKSGSEDDNDAAHSGGSVGWVCPVCGRSLSPYINFCPCGPDLIVTCSSETQTHDWSTDCTT